MVLSSTLIAGVMLAACSSNSPSENVNTSAAAPTAVAGPDWPHWHGPTADAMSAEKGINKAWGTKPPAQLWKVPMTDDGFSGPIVVNGVVYIIDHDGENDIVKALSMTDGKEVWHYTYAEPKEESNGMTRSTPAFDNGKLYTIGRMGSVFCFDAKSGKVLWQRHLVKDFGGRPQGWDYAPSPVIDGEKLLLVPGAPQGAFLALNKTTGATIWQAGGDNVAGYSTPVITKINGVKQYVVFLGKKIAGFKPETGEMIWSFPWNTSFDCNAATPLIIGDAVFITSGYGHGCAMVDVKGTEATQRWFNKDMQAQFSSPVLYKGRIYGTGDPGFLMCLDPDTGKPLWKQPGFEKGGIIGIDGTIVALNGSNGDMIMVDLTPDGYKELGRTQGLGHKSWTAPIVAEGKIIVRDVRSLACLELR